jgi:hypothetical protein
MVRDLIVRRHAIVWLGALLASVLLSGVAVSAQDWRTASGRGGVTVFAERDYRGAAVTLLGDTADLRRYSLNDKVSSIAIPPGEVWEVCQDINYGNRCVVFSSSIPDLGRFGWNDRISSLRPVRGGYEGRGWGGVFSYPGVSERLVMFDRVDYRGASRTVTGESLNLGSFFGNRAGSVEILGGTWELCDSAGGRGRCVTLSSSAPDLSRIGLNGRVTSVRPMDELQGYGYGRGQGNRSYAR